MVIKLSRDVGDVGSPSGSRKHPLPRSVPQFPHSMYKISGRGSSSVNDAGPFKQDFSGELLQECKIRNISS